MGDDFKLVAVALLVTCAIAAIAARDLGPTTVLANVSTMKQAILAQVPIGADVETAREFMKRERIQCMVYTNTGFSGDGPTREGLDFAYCERTDNTGLMEIRQWGVALVFAEDKVTDVLVRSTKIGL